MENITIEELDKLTSVDKCVLLVWAEGCHVCETAKPMYEEMKEKYVDFTFYKMQFHPDILPFYNSVIPKEPTKIKQTTSSGLEITTYKLNEDKTLAMESPLAFPNFLFYSKDEGFLGNVGGLDVPVLTNILESMSNQTKVG